MKPLKLSKKAPATQFAALAWRPAGEGREVLLITSRDTGRWVIAKGWPMAGRKPWEAAAIEAFEEAGVRGEVETTPVGTYRYAKRLPRWRERLVDVQVFCLRVAEELDDWPERRQRERVWLTSDEAAARVDEPDLAEIIRGLG